MGDNDNPDGYRTWCGDCGRSSPTFATMLESRQWKCPGCGNSKVAEEATAIAAEAGVKHDDGKLQWDLIPWDALEPVVRVLMCGAEKYPSADNWRRVNDHRRRYINACLRHILATTRHAPEYIDHETDEPHLAHAVCCLLFLLAMDGR